MVAGVVTFLRYLIAFLVSILSLPLLLPVLLQLPFAGIVTLWYRIALNVLSSIAQLADVDFQFCSPENDRRRNASTIHAPLVKVWTSNVRLKGGKKVVCKTFDQPGRWMDKDDLVRLQAWLRDVAKRAMDCVPSHALFAEDSVQEVFSTRVITIAFDGEVPVGFTAMVYIPFEGSSLLHLGLTMIARSHRGMRLQSPIFTKCLVMPMLNMRRLSYYITNIAASPAGIGAVSDYFNETYPTYKNDNECTLKHLTIARYVLGNYRSEFACSENAVFDENTFVVKGSNNSVGGGAPEFIKEDGKPISFYKNERCNEFCRKRINYAAGDELFQVAKVDFVLTSLKYVLAATKKPQPI